MRTLNRLMLAGLLAFAPLVAMAADDDAPSGEPDVTIRQEGDKTIQEYRVNGFLYAIKVVPKPWQTLFPGPRRRQRWQLHSLRPAGQADSTMGDLQLVMCTSNLARPR